MNIKIIKAPDNIKPYTIIDKPAGLPSAPLSQNDNQNAFSMAASRFPELLNVNGKKAIEHGLIHRLDTATSGLMVIAADQNCYDFLEKEQQENRIIKTYRARCNLIKCSEEGFPAFPFKIDGVQSFAISSYFRPFGPGRKLVRPVTQNSGKAALKKLGKQVLYTTNVKILSIDKSEGTAEVECSITNGYRHQVRCHLAWCGLPVENDEQYNPLVKQKSTEPMKFCAVKIEFEYPRGDLNSYDRKDTWT